MWAIELETLQGVSLGELSNFSSPEFSNLFCRTNTTSFQVPLSSGFANPLMSGRVLVKAYYGADLRFHGRVVAGQRVANRDTQTISITAADPSWFFPKRLVGKSAAGYVQNTLKDRGQIAKDLIDTSQSELSWVGHPEWSDFGLRTGQLPWLSGSTSTYASGPYKPLSEVVADLSVGVYGFDWEVVPIDFTNGKIGDWQAAPILGTLREDVVFTYGPGKGSNVAEINDVVDLQTMANQIFHVADVGPDQPGAPVVAGFGWDTIPIYGLMEDLAQASLIDAGLRQNLVDEHIRVRQWPRRLVTFTPRPHDPVSGAIGDPDYPGNLPIFGRDYYTGDIVRAQAVEQIVNDDSGAVAEQTWFDGYFRVYGYVAKPDANGLESGDLLLVDEGQGGF